VTQLPVKQSANQSQRNGFTITQAAQKLNLHPKTLRRWEQAGKFTPQRTLGNQRRYSQKDLNQLKAIKSGQITPSPPTDKLLTPEQAAQKLHVSSATIRRWTKKNQLKLTVDDQLNQGYSEKTINQLLKTSKPAAIPAPEPPPPLPPSPQAPGLTDSIPWLKHPKLQKAFIYGSVFSLFLSVGLAVYLYLNQGQSPASPSSDQILGAQDIEIALPKTASFLNGRITIGTDTGSLSFLDDQGNLYTKNAALIEAGVFTSSLQLLPSAQPENQIGRQYLDQATGNLMFFDGAEWISLNQTTSTSSSTLQNIYQTGDTTLLAENQDIDITLGSSTATGSATSLRLSLAGPASTFKILGGASQEIITINDDAPYPITISQPTQITANLYVPQLIDTDNNDYYLDPSHPDLGLVIAGDATISETLTFSQYNQSLANSADGYLVSSVGLAVGGKTDYYFNSDGQIKAKQISLDSELTVANIKISDNLIQTTNDSGLSLSNRHSQGLFIAPTGRVGINTATPSALLEVRDGDIRVTNGSFFVDNTALDVPDYVFEDDYQLLSPVSLQEFITTYHHLPGVPSRSQIKETGLNLSQLILDILGKTEENVLYILDLYQQIDNLTTPLPSDHLTAQVVESNVLKPLDNSDLIIQLQDKPLLIQGNASLSGTLTADKVITNELIASKVKASTIEGLRDKIENLVDQYYQDTAVIETETPQASISALIANLQTPPASPSANLELDSLSAEAGFFSEYLAVLGSATITDLKITNTLSINHQLILASNSISTLDSTLYLQPSGQGAINFLAGLMVLDDSGHLTINGNLTVTGLAQLNQVKANVLIASQINTPETSPLQINIASQSAVSLYSPIGQVASIDASGSAQFTSLSLDASGTATISAGTNHIDVTTPELTPDSQVILTFNSNYAPATKYWVVKEPTQHQFNVFVNYPVKQDTLLDWLIIN